MSDSDNQDKSQKTEKPTPKRIQDARKKGQVAFSKEVTTFFIILFFLIFVIWILPFISKNFINNFGHYLDNLGQIKINNYNSQLILKDIILDILKILLIPLLLLFLLIIISSLGQNGFLFTLEPLKIKLNKISPLKGLKRMFSLKSIVELIKGFFKILIVGIISYIVVSVYKNKILSTYNYDLGSFLNFGLDIVALIAFYICIFVLVVAIIDYFYQKYEHTKNLMMSKQDIKDERKQTEGSPEIKSRLKQLRMERSKVNINKAMSLANVVIMNPTHYAIALYYDKNSMNAPICKIKGIDNLALHIKKIAEENKVPVIVNKPLARSLYADVEIDKEIPVQHYKAVAEVISYIINS